MTGLSLPEPTMRHVQRYLLENCASATPALCDHGLLLDGACADCWEEERGYVAERDPEEAETVVRLSQVAPWNPALRNPYRTRWAEVGGRYFKVSADSLESAWDVEEVDHDGETIFIEGAGERRSERLANGHLKFYEIAFRLADAREYIAAEVDGREAQLPGRRRRR